MVGQRPQHAASKLACLVLSSARSCPSCSICLGRLTTAWLVSLVISSPNGDTRGPPVVFEAVDMPCPGPFHFSYIAEYIYNFFPLPDPHVDLSILVCDVSRTFLSILGLCLRKFVLCLFGQCPAATYVIANIVW